MFEVLMIHVLGIEYTVAEFETRSEAELYVEARRHELDDDVRFAVRGPQDRYLADWADAEGMDADEFVDWLTGVTA